MPFGEPGDFVDRREPPLASVGQAAYAHRDHPWIEHRVARRQRRERCAAVDSTQPRRWARGTAVGQQRLPAHARLVHLARWLARRHIWRAPSLRAGCRRLWRGIGALRDCALDSGLDCRSRAAGIGTWTAWGTIAGALGPLVGGELLGVGSWRWIFVINVPLVLACLFLTLTAVPSITPGGVREKVDVLGAMLCVLGLGGPVFALIEQPRLGWSRLAVSGSLVGGGLGFGALLFPPAPAG